MKRIMAIFLAAVLLASCTKASVPERNSSGSSNPSDSSENDSSASVLVLQEPEEAEEHVREDIQASAATSYDAVPNLRLPKESCFGTAEDLEEYEKILSELRFDEVESLLVVSVPNDREITCQMTAAQAQEIIACLKEHMPSVFLENENPATGGAMDIYLFTADMQLGVGFNGNWVTMAAEGFDTAWIFDAAPCEEEFYEIWQMTKSLLEQTQS